MGQSFSRCLGRRRGGRTAHGTKPEQCTDDQDFIQYGYPLTNLTSVDSDYLARESVQENLTSLGSDCRDSVQEGALEAPRPAVVTRRQYTPRQAKFEEDTTNPCNCNYRSPIQIVQLQQQPDPSSHDHCETSFTTHHVKARSESTVNLHSKLHEDDELSCLTMEADEETTFQYKKSENVPIYLSNPSIWEHACDHHLLQSKSPTVASSQIEDSCMVPMQREHNSIPHQLPLQIDSHAYCLSPELTIEHNSVPHQLLTTPYLDQHQYQNTSNLSTGPVHGQSYNMLPPAMQNLPSQLVTSTTFFEIEGELARNKLRAISNYTNVISSSCDHNGGIIISKDGDLKLTIPQGAIKEGDSIKFFIATSLFYPFKFHRNDFMLHQNSLASPYYHIMISKFYRFYKPVQVEFQCFANTTACDPSHYQLQSCEDDDESHTMKPVNCALNFSIQDDISWCTFQTELFCSYCLLHSCTHPIVTRIGAFFLKPKNFQSLDKFRVEVWFSFLINHCLERNKELYTRKGMILDTDCIHSFDVASDRKGTSYFALNYEQCDDGWDVSRNGPNKIYTKDINFYNFYQDMESLKAIEEIGLFPPRFILEIEKKTGCTNNLNRKIMAILFKTENTSSTSEPVSFKLYVPASTTAHLPMQVKFNLEDPTIYIPQDAAIPSHRCTENRPEHRDIMKYSEKITRCWKRIAYHLGVSEEKVNTIDIDYHWSVEQKCIALFKTWLEKSHCCWCHFIKALYTVGLSLVAEETKAHLKSHKVEELALGTTDLYQLEKFLNHVSNQDLKYFVFRLLSKDGAVKVLKDIRHNEGNKEESIKKICRAFSKEKDSSWTRVHKALKDTKCDDLADIIEASFL